ncbi:MAG: glycosyltransferase [Hyphomicrobiales bacterium]
MPLVLNEYDKIVGTPVIDQLRRLGDRLKGKKILHVNSTAEGGGVAEILAWMTPLMQDLGIDADWLVIEGNKEFFGITKSIHNGLQGTPSVLRKRDWETYLDVNRHNAEKLGPLLQEADVAVIHDPQPAALLQWLPKRRGRWIWRAHIDVSHPFRPVWKSLQPFVQAYDASIFSMAQFAQLLPHPQYIIAPSIDPLSEKNIDLDNDELDEARDRFGLDPALPTLVQISRFDRFKDPLGVIKAYRLVTRVKPIQLVLAGGGASDDPEGSEVLAEVMEESEKDPHIHVHLLPANAHRTINALQRLADIIIQKSTREGFGLTVTEGLWKGKPVIGGDAGGIRLQVIDHYTGFLVSTPEGAAHRIRFLLHHGDRRMQMSNIAREFVRENFLLTRHLRAYLTLILSLLSGEWKPTVVV